MVGARSTGSQTAPRAGPHIITTTTTVALSLLDGLGLGLEPASPTTITIARYGRVAVTTHSDLVEITSVLATVFLPFDPGCCGGWRKSPHPCRCPTHEFGNADLHPHPRREVRDRGTRGRGQPRIPKQRIDRADRHFSGP
jgi:hypothetical protein